MDTGLLRVMILEDDEDIVDLIESILDGSYEFITAENGMEGLQMAEAGEPDLVICDVMMPVMDGWDFIKALREKPGFEKTPVIVLSALSAQDQIKKGYALGAALYLTKPIDPARLKRNIELFIDDHGIVARPKRKRADQLRPGGADFLKRIDRSRPVVPPRPQAAPAPQPASPAPAAHPMAPQPQAPSAHERTQVPAPAGPAYPGHEGTETHKRILPAEIRRAARPGHDQMRIMVVEDDKDTCEMLQVALESHYEVVEANDGLLAIERAVKYLPDLFIIDGMLPRMTGYQLTMLLRKNREFGKAPIIFISDKATPRDQEYARSLGISQFLAKPFALTRLLELVQDVVMRPDFAVRIGREPLPQNSVPQNFTHYEAHRQTMETPTLAEMEQQSLEHRLKQQLQ